MWLNWVCCRSVITGTSPHLAPDTTLACSTRMLSARVGAALPSGRLDDPLPRHRHTAQENKWDLTEHAHSITTDNIKHTPHPFFFDDHRSTLLAHTNWFSWKLQIPLGRPLSLVEVDKKETLLRETWFLACSTTYSNCYCTRPDSYDRNKNSRNKQTLNEKKEHILLVYSHQTPMQIKGVWHICIVRNARDFCLRSILSQSYTMCANK